MSEQQIVKIKKGSQTYDDNSSGTEASEASSNGYADSMQAEPSSNEEEEEEHVYESEGEVYSDTEDRESISTQKEGEEPDEENFNIPKEVKDFVVSSINNALSQFKLELKQTMDDAVTSMTAPIQRLIDYSSTSAKTEMVKGICRKEIETALPDIYSHVVKMQKTDESKKHVSGTPSESKNSSKLAISSRDPRTTSSMKTHSNTTSSAKVGTSTSAALPRKHTERPVARKDVTSLSKVPNRPIDKAFIPPVQKSVTCDIPVPKSGSSMSSKHKTQSHKRRMSKESPLVGPKKVKSSDIQTYFNSGENSAHPANSQDHVSSTSLQIKLKKKTNPSTSSAGTSAGISSAGSSSSEIEPVPLSGKIAKLEPALCAKYGCKLTYKELPDQLQVFVSESKQPSLHISLPPALDAFMNFYASWSRAQGSALSDVKEHATTYKLVSKEYADGDNIRFKDWEEKTKNRYKTLEKRIGRSISKEALHAFAKKHENTIKQFLSKRSYQFNCKPPPGDAEEIL